MLALYTLTIFVGAMLLFGVQPMFARLILPMLGGSPAVWNTAMVFFQAALLGGYVYAHASTRRLGPRRQSRWHLVVLLLPLAVLPLSLPGGWVPPVNGSPIPWLFLLMTVTVGLPFFVLSTTSPVLQSWFASTRHESARDPYFLYAASNVGSLLALLAYPLLLEPRLTLAMQTRLWTGGYVLFVALVTACAFSLRGQSVPTVAENETINRTTPAPTNKTRLHWVVLAALPSSLLLGVTSYVSSEVAVVPLLWVIPLALYLLTFVLAFAKKRPVPTSGLQRALPLAATPVIMVLATQATEPIVMLAAFHLIFFFITAWLCHSRLSDLRPASDHLTEFYLWLSVGGVIGGAFNALLAPVIFDSVTEYPLGIILTCLLVLPAVTNRAVRSRIADFVLPALLLAAAFGMLSLAGSESFRGDEGAARIAFGMIALVCFFFSKRPLRFALGLSVLLLSGSVVRQHQARVLATKRSFYGVHRVVHDESGGFHRLSHGRIQHGLQSLDPARRHEALTYYHQTGPVGQIMDTFAATPDKTVAVVGLGAGSMAAYAKPGQPWTFYEIDPEVLRLATNPAYFTFIGDSAGKINYMLGDARLSLINAADASYDLLVLDAYSSDAIPVHLVTREALALYLKKLRPGGVLAFHISNLNLDLEPVFGNLARDAGLVAEVRDDIHLSPEETKAGKFASTWLVMAHDAKTLTALEHDSRWEAARTATALAVWTDDYSSLLSVIRWR